MWFEERRLHFHTGNLIGTLCDGQETRKGDEPVVYPQIRGFKAKAHIESYAHSQEANQW